MNCSLLGTVIWNAKNCKRFGEYAYAIFLGCENLKTVTFEAKVQMIPDYLFEGCSSLTSIEIPENVTSIGERAFENCTMLETIVIPGTVTSIGSSAFYNCSLLLDIQFKGTVKEWQTIQKVDGWNAHMSNYTITCTDGKIAKDGSVTYF